ncbi:MAG: response regulator [Gammaproteobacteria bacterium]|nr:response regulator [Gammaproteobacteria bacterium]MBT4811512.1 response regulator [Thiotrichales bacterium]MBT3473725.1 response regulator [Gammaproteobacteria bacterium]MBT3967031.1 response regulator [Gammaproteobacteria bacterium]MBT4081742.1 response regulator [Gammaproteobacteria bacterium]
MANEHYTPLNILFVDDSAAVRAVYEQLLKKAGYCVALAAGPEQALELTRSFIPDISIIDYYMPNGGGVELTRRLLQQTNTQNTLLVIHTDQRVSAADALSLGAMDVMYKRDSVDLFLLRIASMERYIRTQQANREQATLQAQNEYAAFQQGVAEMSANILHNVGNTIQGMRSSLEEVLLHFEDLKKIQSLYAELIDSLAMERASGGEQRLEQLEQTLTDAGYRLPEALDNLLVPTGHCFQKLGKGIDHVTEVIRVQQRGVHSDVQRDTFSLRQLVDDLFILSESELSQREINFKQWNIPAFPEVKLPRNQLLQALINLVKNAAESIDARIEAGELEPGKGEILLKMDSSAKMLSIEVSDNGAGFTKAEHPHLLEFGFTTKVSGNGFGLHAVGNFVGLCNGKMEIQSPGPWLGAIVVLSLPI